MRAPAQNLTIFVNAHVDICNGFTDRADTIIGFGIGCCDARAFRLPVKFKQVQTERAIPRD